MEIYIGLIGITFIILMYTMNIYDGTVVESKKNVNLRWSFVILFVCILLQGLRATSVGGDLADNYVRVFHECGELSWSQIFNFSSGYEIGYVIINKIIYLIFGPNDFGMRMLLFAIAVIFNISFYVLIRKCSSNPLYSVFLFVGFGVFNISMNNLRSTLALSLIYLAILFAAEKRILKTLFFIAVASLFHTTAICFILFVISLLIKNRKILIAYYALMAGAFIIGYSVFGGVIEQYFPKYSYYLSATDGGDNYLLFLIVILFFVLIIPVRGFYDSSKEVLISETFYCKETGLDKDFADFFLEDTKQIVFLKVFCCGVILQLISLRASFFVRAVNYHLIGAILLLPNINGNSKLKNGMGLFTVFIGMLFIVFYIIMILIGNGTRTIPYVFYWEEIGG